jgi:hypothetical protein
MGLDAKVYVNAMHLAAGVDHSRATVNPHTGEVTLDSGEEFIAAHKRLGNAAMIRWLSEQVTSVLAGLPNPVLVTKILYSGSHSGDVIGAAEFPQLQQEIQVVRESSGERIPVEIEQFLLSIEELMRIAQDQGNPIVFV